MPDSTPFSGAVQTRFDAYLDTLADAVGHADRDTPVRLYCTGLLLPGDRKSVEPMAAVVRPDSVSSVHQAMHHFVANAPWSDAGVLRTARQYVLPFLKEQDPELLLIVDDTGIPKKGKHSVGVIRQYCGVLGKQENCQVAVSLSVANQRASLPIAFRLYLPEEWANDPERRKEAGIPDDVRFQTKIEIALNQIEGAIRDRNGAKTVLADAAYGNDTDFREQIREWGLTYAVGIQSSTSVWPEGTGPLPAPAYGGYGRPAKLLRRDTEHQPVAVKTLACSLPEDAYRQVEWRKGSYGMMHGRFATIRVRAAHRDTNLSDPRNEEWLLIEWPLGESEPTKYFLSSLALDTPIEELVRTVKGRWRIERDYQELKDEIGLDHYEGRGWRGFHHHATLCIAAYAFLIAERSLFSPSGYGGEQRLKAIGLSPCYKPRGAPVKA
jgi:SRSO17 transposase